MGRRPPRDRSYAGEDGVPSWWSAELLNNGMMTSDSGGEGGGEIPRDFLATKDVTDMKSLGQGWPSCICQSSYGPVGSSPSNDVLLEREPKTR